MKDFLYCVEKEFTVEFYDVDSMNVVWYAREMAYREKGMEEKDIAELKKEHFAALRAEALAERKAIRKEMGV